MRRKVSAPVFQIDQNVLVGHTVDYVNQGCTYFFNAQHKYVQLLPYQRAYFDYICERMNAYNRIMLEPKLREEFLEFYHKVTSVRMVRSLRSLQSTEVKLCDLHLLFLDPVNKILHYVNPKHVFKGTVNERSRLLADLSKLAMTDVNVFKAISDIPYDSLKAGDEILNLGYPDHYTPGVV